MQIPIWELLSAKYRFCTFITTNIAAVWQLPFACRLAIEYCAVRPTVCPFVRPLNLRQSVASCPFFCAAVCLFSLVGCSKGHAVRATVAWRLLATT